MVADVGCRNTVFGAEAQEASQHLAAWMDAGIRHFRLEFAHETAEEVTRVTRAFQTALVGEGDVCGFGACIEGLCAWRENAGEFVCG